MLIWVFVCQLCLCQWPNFAFHGTFCISRDKFCVPQNRFCGPFNNIMSGMKERCCAEQHYVSLYSTSLMKQCCLVRQNCVQLDSAESHWTALGSISGCCTPLPSIALHLHSCAALHCPALHCIAQRCSASHSAAVHCTA